MSTYDDTTAASADTDLGPLAAALRKAWRDAGAFTAAQGPHANAEAMSAILDAVHALETRVGALEDA